MEREYTCTVFDGDRQVASFDVVAESRKDALAEAREICAEDGTSFTRIYCCLWGSR